MYFFISSSFSHRCGRHSARRRIGLSRFCFPVRRAKKHCHRHRRGLLLSGSLHCILRHFFVPVRRQPRSYTYIYRRGRQPFRTRIAVLAFFFIYSVFVSSLWVFFLFCFSVISPTVIRQKKWFRIRLRRLRYFGLFCVVRAARPFSSLRTEARVVNGCLAVAIRSNRRQ